MIGVRVSQNVPRSRHALSRFLCTTPLLSTNIVRTPTDVHLFGEPMHPARDPQTEFFCETFAARPLYIYIFVSLYICIFVYLYLRVFVYLYLWVRVCWCFEAEGSQALQIAAKSEGHGCPTAVGHANYSAFEAKGLQTLQITAK